MTCQDLEFMQSWVSTGPQWGPIMGYGLGCGLALITQDPYGLGPGSESSTHSWVVSKTNPGILVLQPMIESNISSKPPYSNQKNFLKMSN